MSGQSLRDRSLARYLVGCAARKAPPGLAQRLEEEWLADLMARRGERRLGETGTSVVSVCVDPRGRLTGAPAITTSSGIRQIDEGALRLARAGSGHYQPTTEDGRPVSSCYAFRIRFQLADQ